MSISGISLTYRGNTIFRLLGVTWISSGKKNREQMHRITSEPRRTYDRYAASVSVVRRYNPSPERRSTDRMVTITERHAHCGFVYTCRYDLGFVVDCLLFLIHNPCLIGHPIKILTNHGYVQRFLYRKRVLHFVLPSKK